jgi:hypothetical protein
MMIATLIFLRALWSGNLELVVVNGKSIEKYQRLAVKSNPILLILYAGSINDLAGNHSTIHQTVHHNCNLKKKYFFFNYFFY